MVKAAQAELLNPDGSIKNRFMSKVKADAIARKRGKKPEVTTQSEKELQTTDLNLITYAGSQAKIFVTSSRNANTIGTVDREARLHSFGEINRPIYIRSNAKYLTKRRSEA